MNNALKQLSANSRRVREYRQRVKDSSVRLSVTVPRIVIDIVDKYIGIAGDTRTEIIENALLTWACDAAEVLPQIRAKMGVTQ